MNASRIGTMEAFLLNSKVHFINVHVHYNIIYIYCTTDTVGNYPVKVVKPYLLIKLLAITGQ